MQFDVAVKELLYCWTAGNFSVLIPKKRGEGYLKVPYGHHYIVELTEIGTQMGCDVDGLDGALTFDVKGAIYHGSQKGREEFSGEVMPLLEKYYGLPSREITNDDFWRLNPVK